MQAQVRSEIARLVETSNFETSRDYRNKSGFSLAVPHLFRPISKQIPICFSRTVKLTLPTIHHLQGLWSNEHSIAYVEWLQLEFTSSAGSLVRPPWRAAAPGLKTLRLPHAQLQVIFRERATCCRALLRKMTYIEKTSYGSWPPCMHLPWLHLQLEWVYEWPAYN